MEQHTLAERIGATAALFAVVFVILSAVVLISRLLGDAFLPILIASLVISVVALILDSLARSLS